MHNRRWLPHDVKSTAAIGLFMTCKTKKKLHVCHRGGPHVN